MISARTLSAISLRVCLLQFVVIGAVHAQYYDSPGLDRMPVASYPQDSKPLGVRAGAFMLHPGVQLGAQWTDNVFYANNALKSDTIYHIRPYINAQSTWSRHSLNINLAADFARYQKYKERDYEDYFFGINGRVDVKIRSAFRYSADYMDLHQGLDNRSSEQGVEPTRYHVYGGGIGYNHAFNRVTLDAAYALTWMDFDNVVAADGSIIDNQDEDRKNSTYSLRAGYQLDVSKELFISYTGYTVDFDQKYDRNDYDRSGDGYTINAGVALNVTGRLQGDFFFSYYNRNFDDPRLPSNSGWVWVLAGSAGLEFHPTDLTSVYGRISSGVYDTTDANSTSYLQTLYSLRVDHELLRNVQLNGFAAYSVNNYQPIDPTAENLRTKDNVLRLGVGVNWFINRFMYLNASYDHEKLYSSLPLDDYTANNIWLMLGLEY